MTKIAFHNLGCKVNGYETDAMIESVREHGYTVVPFEEKADIYVVNTCTVTNIADRKSRQMLHRAKKHNPEAIVVAVGCYVETDAEGVKKDPAVDLAIGNADKIRFAEILEEFLALHGEELPTDAGCTAAQTMETDAPKSQTGLSERARAFVKIQDGCNQFCTYCIIPYARGRVRSRNEEDILEEIRNIAAKGTKEVVITGIHIGSYGGGNEALLSLILKVCEIPGIERIRLGSLEPRTMTEDFIKAISGQNKICPHFHLALQSGCDATLKRMNRHYTTEEFMESVDNLRKYYDRPAITTDVIVGFPGETSAEFGKTLDFLEKVNFYEIHVFKYSVRHGTVAAGLPDQVPEGLKAKRSDDIQKMTLRQSEAYRRSFYGEHVEILTEETKTAAEMKQRTQNEMSPVKAGETGNSSFEGGKADGGSTRYITGHTKQYLQCAIPVAECAECFDGCDDTDDHIQGLLIKGKLVSEIPGSPYLLVNRDDLG
ncbi:MAG: tRNA (N(6)-L-threonylcarbamoyladenosine(37)-C(2))-methylthiotransferase MtaB [Lachnospiraceae bacterium]|nr:tRNA (N(6)-L-threonylcarbamoyladenosine(37)-C(2))-methylthiotransferase MtaB [Lachnospiraceae bacterium]